MAHPFTLLVNSSDGFEDCWPPFFTLLQRYWPGADFPVLLNTENKTWSWPGVDLTCSQAATGCETRPTWSACLITALEQIRTPLVLYMQEDYFLHQSVLAERIARYARWMLDNPEIGHIGLTGHGSHGPFEATRHPELMQIGAKARYRISTQAGLWRPATLKSYLVPEENGWMFEIYGTWRAHRRPDTFLTASVAPEFGGPCIDYLHTGIIKGQWLQEIAPVFAANGITVDFSGRGFYQPKSPLMRKIETGRQILRSPGYFMTQLLAS